MIGEKKKSNEKGLNLCKHKLLINHLCFDIGQ
ncbi:MAG: hypothetical protein ACI85I_001383 [Arenicella sp.]|jgi:hypothetical protein